MKTNLIFLWSLAAIIAAVTCITCEAQSTPADVPEIAQQEIARRGSHVEMTGTIRSGLMAAALAPPADDSAKWFLTLIVKPGDVSSEKMKLIIATDPAVRPWVDVREPMKSAMHYQVRSTGDATQADWLAGLQPALNRSGLTLADMCPLVVVQPPKNGQFGKSSVVVKMVSGVVTGEQLATRLRDGIIAYVRALESPPGISQSVIGAPPPFNVPPPVAPVAPPQGPVDWPPTPPPVVPPSPSPNPSVPVTDHTNLWLALTALVSLIVGWVGKGVKTSLNEKLAGFARVIAILSNPPPPPSPPNPSP